MPLRLRLTLAFAAIMALVVGGLGTFVYLRLAAGSSRRSRSGDRKSVV